MSNTISDDTRALAVAALTEYMACALAEYEKPPIRAIIADLAVAGGQAAQGWQPLPDGEYGNVEIEGYILATWFCDNKIKEFLPDDIRLCRLVPAPVVQGGGA